MIEDGVDNNLLHAWLSARSIARALPAPVADYGGYRVDTNSDIETRRWVFSQLGDGLAELANSIREPRHFLKLCGEEEALASILPDRWQLQPPSYFMQRDGVRDERQTPTGYLIGMDIKGGVIEVRILSQAGELAASGYAAETREAFVFDRIITSPDHRRKGLGGAVMTALQQAKRGRDTPELLVATIEGRALYATMGWQTLSTYSSASIPDMSGARTEGPVRTLP